jgi:hypothetical protein
MAAVAFDTLAYVKKLRAVGFTEEQAEVQAEALSDALGEQLVTKQHLDMRLSEVKSDVIKWVAAMLVAQAGVIATLMKLLGLLNK